MSSIQNLENKDDNIVKVINEALNLKEQQESLALAYLSEQVATKKLATLQALKIIEMIGLADMASNLFGKKGEELSQNDLEDLMLSDDDLANKFAAAKLLAGMRSLPVEDFLDNDDTATLLDNPLYEDLSQNQNKNILLPIAKLANEVISDKISLNQALKSPLIADSDNAQKQFFAYLNKDKTNDELNNIINRPHNDTEGEIASKLLSQRLGSIPDTKSTKDDETNTKNKALKDTQTNLKSTPSKKAPKDSDAVQKPDKIPFKAKPHIRESETDNTQTDGQTAQETPDIQNATKTKSDSTKDAITSKVKEQAKKATKKVVKKGLKYLLTKPPVCYYVWAVILFVVIVSVIVIISSTATWCMKNVPDVVFGSVTQDPKTAICRSFGQYVPKQILQDLKKQLNPDITSNLGYNADSSIGADGQSFTPKKPELEAIDQGLTS